jgi:hypothetical protein
LSTPHVNLGLPCGLFPSGFPTNILYAFLFSPHSCYMPCTSHPPWLHHSNSVNNSKLFSIWYITRHFRNHSYSLIFFFNIPVMNQSLASM